jgi:uncharacterized membrane protein YjgN (DUF898 family)
MTEPQDNPASDDSGANTVKHKALGDITFHGRVREIIGLVFKNFVLNIITIGFYRFWARTKVRRYLWENMYIMRSPLEYTGTGKELFLGFLMIIFIIFLPYAVLNGVLESMGYLQGPSTSSWISLGTGALFIYLIGVATYRARRYRLTRTRWRGIRAGQTGSSWKYSLWYILYTYLTAVLGLILPWKNMHLWRLRAENTFVGDKHFVFDPDDKARKCLAGLYKKFSVFWLITTPSVTAPIVAFWYLYHAASSEHPGLTSEEAGGIAGSKIGSMFDKDVSGGLMLTIWALLLLAVPISLAWYKLHETRALMQLTTFEGLRLSFRAGLFKFLAMYIGNLIITICTLGFGTAFTQVRFARFVGRHTDITGELNLASIMQSDDDDISNGEGLADAFDMGAV